MSLSARQDCRGVREEAWDSGLHHRWNSYRSRFQASSGTLSDIKRPHPATPSQPPQGTGGEVEEEEEDKDEDSSNLPGGEGGGGEVGDGGGGEFG